jgi:SEC-C motif-containing protein
MHAEADNPCPCESGLTFSKCCGPIHLDPQNALTPTALMRSRYSAYVIGNETHLLKTWHPTTRPSRVRIDPHQRWLGLQIKHAKGDTVEFVARFKIHGKGHRLHETSRFQQVAELWYYMDGEIHEGAR